MVPRYIDEPERFRTAHPWAYDWDAAPAFDRASYQELAETLRRELTRMGFVTPMRVSSRRSVSASYQELAETLRRELTRMGVTKPMRYDPGANAGSP